MILLTEDYMHLFIVLDNDTIHHAKITLDYSDDNLQMDFFFLPVYSPELNPIEFYFHHYIDEFLDSGEFCSTTEDYEEAKKTGL